MAALNERIESAAGYDDLRAIAMVRFRDELSGAVCKAMRCALVELGLKPSEVDMLTLVEVVARLRPGTTPPSPPPNTGIEGKRCRASVELAAVQFTQGLASLKEENPCETGFTDQEVYDNLEEIDCPLPAAERWFRHVRSARQAKLLEAKNQPRTPYTGRSAVPASHRA